MQDNIGTIITVEILQDAFKELLNKPVRYPMTQAEYDLWNDIYNNPPKYG